MMFHFLYQSLIKDWQSKAAEKELRSYGLITNHHRHKTWLYFAIERIAFPV